MHHVLIHLPSATDALTSTLNADVENWCMAAPPSQRTTVDNVEDLLSSLSRIEMLDSSKPAQAPVTQTSFTNKLSYTTMTA